jgi:hypothetical protein
MSTTEVTTTGTTVIVTVIYYFFFIGSYTMMCPRTSFFCAVLFLIPKYVSILGAESYMTLRCFKMTSHISGSVVRLKVLDRTVILLFQRCCFLRITASKNYRVPISSFIFISLKSVNLDGFQARTK